MAMGTVLAHGNQDSLAIFCFSNAKEPSVAWVRNKTASTPPLTTIVELKKKITIPSSAEASLLATTAPSRLLEWRSGKHLPNSITKETSLISLNGPKEVMKYPDINSTG